MQKIQIILKRIGKDLRDFWGAIVAFALYSMTARMVFHAFCPQLILTGFPCAGCGMTRAVFFILTGRFARGMRLNPAAPLWILFLGWFFANRYLRGVRPKYVTLWLGLVCVVTFVVYLYRMLHYFPGEPPLVYHSDNILRRILMGL